MEETHIRTREYLFVIGEEGQYKAFDPEEGDYWNLNETEAFIVRNLVKGVSLEELKEKILKEYDIGPEELEGALQEHIDRLKEVGIILEG